MAKTRFMRVYPGERSHLLRLREAAQQEARDGSTWLGGALMLAHGRKRQDGTLEGRVTVMEVLTGNEALDSVGREVIRNHLMEAPGRLAVMEAAARSGRH